MISTHIFDTLLPVYQQLRTQSDKSATRNFNPELQYYYWGRYFAYDYIIDRITCTKVRSELEDGLTQEHIQQICIDIECYIGTMNQYIDMHKGSKKYRHTTQPGATIYILEELLLVFQELADDSYWQ